LQAVRQRFPDRVFLLCARMPRDMADEFATIGFLTFEDPTRAISTVAALARLRAGFDGIHGRAAAAAMPAAAALPKGPINEAEAKRLLAAAGVSFAQEKTARTRDEAAAVAQEIGFPVVLKVLSADIAHKSEVGGVVLGLKSQDDVAKGF